MHYAVVRRHKDCVCSQKWQRQTAEWAPPPPHHHHRTPILRFGNFCQLGGSKWTGVVLCGRGVPLGRYGHPTCLFLAQSRIRPKMGPQIWRNGGQMAKKGPRKRLFRLLAASGPGGRGWAPFPVSRDTSAVWLGWTHFHQQFLRGGQIGVFG